MAKPPLSPFSRFCSLLFLLSLLAAHLSVTLVLAADSHFEGFDADEEEDDIFLDSSSTHFADLRSPPLTQSEPPSSATTTKLTPPSDEQTPDQPPATDPVPPTHNHPDQSSAHLSRLSSSAAFDYWDEDEFEGLPILLEPQHQPPPPPLELETTTSTSKDAAAGGAPTSTDPKSAEKSKLSPRSFLVEIVCVSFLIMFAINYFTGKRENENIALSWATKFATEDSIFEKNFSLLGVGQGEDSPLLLKEGQNVFKFYASGRRYCQGLLATLELKSRHDLISRIYNLVVPCNDEISFEVYMNDDAMDNVVFAVAKKKLAKVMQKEERDLQRYAGLMMPPSGRKWVADELSVISESKEVAGDLITAVALDQVFGEKAFEKLRKSFISMHFSDQHPGTHNKILLFKFVLPDINHMADMTRLVALIPYYIDLVGRYKLSPQARSKTEGARAKAAQEAYKELQQVRQEALQNKKAEKKKLMEEAAAAEGGGKLSSEALRKKEAKERARQMKKAMPKMKMTRAH